jgi:hypothetical protein
MPTNRELIERMMQDYESKTLLYPPFTSSKLRRGHKGFLGALFCAVGLFTNHHRIRRSSADKFFREGMKAYIDGYRRVLRGENKPWVVSSSFDSEYVENITGGVFKIARIAESATLPVLVVVDFTPDSKVLSYYTEETESIFRFDSLFGLYDPAEDMLYFFVEPYNFEIPANDPTINKISLYELILTDKGKSYAE